MIKKMDYLLKRWIIYLFIKNIENIGLRPSNIHGLDLDHDLYALNRDKYHMVKLYRDYELMGDNIDDKFNYLNKVYELINKYKNSDKLKTIDQKNQHLSAALKVYNNLSNSYKTEYFENIKNYDENQQKMYNYKNLKNLPAKDLFGGIDISWIDNNRLYEIIKKDVYDMIRKGNRSKELEYIVNFLDEIDNEYIKNKKDAQKGLKIVKQNVKIEASKNIVKELEKALIGYDGDDGDDDDGGDDDGGDENIGERVKLKNQNKKEFEEKYATGNKTLDNITKKLLGQTCNPKPNKKETFKGFKIIIDNYENGLKSYFDIVREKEGVFE